MRIPTAVVRVLDRFLLKLGYMPILSERDWAALRLGWRIRSGADSYLLTRGRDPGQWEISGVKLKPVCANPSRTPSKPQLRLVKGGLG